jgi:hypothetical protein
LLPPFCGARKGTDASGKLNFAEASENPDQLRMVKIEPNERVPLAGYNYLEI